MVWRHKADIRCSDLMSLRAQKLKWWHCGWLVSPAYDWGVWPLHLLPSQASMVKSAWLLDESLLIHTALAEHSNAASNPKIFHPKNHPEDNTATGGNVGTSAFAKTPSNHFGFACRKCPERSDRFASSWTPLRLHHGLPRQQQPPKPFQTIHITSIHKQSKNVLHTKLVQIILFLMDFQRLPP